MTDVFRGSKLLVTINALSAEDYRGMSQALEECPFSSIRIAESNAPEDEADSAPITRTAEVPRSVFDLYQCSAYDSYSFRSVSRLLSSLIDAHRRLQRITQHHLAKRIRTFSANTLLA